MQDLTQGSITRHLLSMAAFIAMGLIFQTLYLLVDLYFVSRLGSDAIAGVSAAGVTNFLVMGLTQLVAVGAMSIAARSIGAKDMDEANNASNQAFGLSLLFAAATLAIGYAIGGDSVSRIAADTGTQVAARAYLNAFLPSLALMFPSAVLTSSLRAAGVVQQPMLIQTGTVLLNAALAPVLIAGWGTHMPLGVTGAGLASSISVALGFVALILLFPRVQKHLRLHLVAPNFREWGRIVGIGLPAAGEFILMFVIFGVVYWVIRGFGPHAQAGFGVGQRVAQSIFLPAMAVAFATGPIAGQNFGAGRADRVRETFRQAALISAGIMLALTLLCQTKPELLMLPFTTDADALEVGKTYLHMLSWNFVATGFAFTCSSMFQGLGDTRPSFLASATRLITFAAPAIWLSGRPGTTLPEIWWLSVASVYFQAALAFLLLRMTLNKKLNGLQPRAVPQPAAA